MRNNSDTGDARTRDRLLPFSPPGRDTMVLMLTWAAGSVDAISYLALDHVFTANMTGNTVLLGLALGQGHGWAALRSIVALAGFALGAALGAMIVERGPKRGDWPAAVTKAIFLEGVILGIFAVTWHLPGIARSGSVVYALIALSAVAMGMQSAAIRHLNVPGVATTYITGTLTSFMAGFVGWLGSVDLLSSTSKSVANTANTAVPASPAAQKKHGARLQAAVFLIYGLAAVASGIIQVRWSAFVTLSPLVAVALVVINASLRHRDE